MKSQILRILIENRGSFISGEEMSRICGISRAAVWKHIDHLKKEGYGIEAVTKKGYKLLENREKMETVFLELPKEQVIGSRYIYLAEVDSTNAWAKTIAKEEPDGTVVIANYQTAGKGRFGKTWDSTRAKGIWLSLILKPKASMAEAVLLTQMAGAAVCHALISLGFEARIKWPNDIVIGDKKICGILAELSGEPEQLNYVVVGIGINVNQDLEDFPPDLRDRAASLKMMTSDRVDRNRILAQVLSWLDHYYSRFNNKSTAEIMGFCRENSATLDKSVKVIYNDKIILGKAINLTDKGALIIEDTAGQVMEIISGEVSVRGLFGYV